MNGLKHQKEKRSRALLCFEMKTITTIGRFIMIETILSKLEQRLGGRLYARQRLGIETDHGRRFLAKGSRSSTLRTGIPSTPLSVPYSS